MMCHKINYVKREALKIKASLFLGSLSNVGVTNNLSTSEGISARRYSFHFIPNTIRGALIEKNS